ncbi:MAG: adenosylhomocysteinase [Elusimicrobia bacterium]|nr:adenosylhomocysteinase [Elusimicrobiota bacterium]
MDKTEDLKARAWIARWMPRTRRALRALRSLRGQRWAMSVHLEPKMVLWIKSVLEHGAAVFLTSCNPDTTRDEVVSELTAAGAEAVARRGMTPGAWKASFKKALDWGPTHLIEMGGDLTAAWHRRPGERPRVRAAIEATGSGISRLGRLSLRYPVLNLDAVPIKAGLHNRHMVGITALHAFCERTRLTLHEKTALVIGYGPVGRGVCEAARAYGGSVLVCDRDPARALEARYRGWETVGSAEGLRRADLVITATGVPRVVTLKNAGSLKDGAFLMNVGHGSDEIDPALRAHPKRRKVAPFVEAIALGRKTIHLFAGGSMANLVAGHGDSINAFDVPAAVLVSAIGFAAGRHGLAPGLHALPERVWKAVASSTRGAAARSR